MDLLRLSEKNVLEKSIEWFCGVSSTTIWLNSTRPTRSGQMKNECAKKRNTKPLKRLRLLRNNAKRKRFKRWPKKQRKQRVAQQSQSTILVQLHKIRLSNLPLTLHL